MLFNTISEYDEELDEIKSILDSMEPRLDEEPLSFARKGNYRTLKEIYNIILNDKNDFLAMMEESINLHISGDEVKNHNISLPIIMGLFGNFQDLTTLLSNFLKDSRNYAFEVICSLCREDPEHLQGVELAKNFGQNSALMAGYHAASGDVVFSMDDDITNLEEVYLNHQVFEKLLDLVDCNIDDLD